MRKFPKVAILLLVALAVSALIASSASVAGDKKDAAKEVTARELENFGEDLVGKQCQLASTFYDLGGSDWVKSYGLDPKTYISVFVKDAKGTPYTKAFVKKGQYGAEFLNVNKGNKLTMTGTVTMKGRHYLFFVEKINELEKKGK